MYIVMYPKAIKCSYLEDSCYELGRGQILVLVAGSQKKFYTIELESLKTWVPLSTYTQRWF
jgi:hypothetical protein